MVNEWLTQPAVTRLEAGRGGVAVRKVSQIPGKIGDRTSAAYPKQPGLQAWRHLGRRKLARDQ